MASVDIERVAVLGDPPRHHLEIDRAAGAEGRAHGRVELGVGGEHHHAGSVRLGWGCGLIRMTFTRFSAYFTGAADCVTVGPTGAVLFGARPRPLLRSWPDVPMPRGGITRPVR